MSLKKSSGNMYPWVTHTHSHLRGACPHRCGYCYVQAMERKFGGGHYKGPLRLEEKEFAVNYGTGRTIFIEHCNDLFAEEVPELFIKRVLGHCSTYANNTFVFQTKNPHRMAFYRSVMPPKRMLGCTIESNRQFPVMGNAPHPLSRASAMEQISPYEKTFVTVEPILDFDVKELLSYLVRIRPTFINIGADSKGHGLPEPSAEKVVDLITGLQFEGIEIREKRNLDRLLKAKQ